MFITIEGIEGSGKSTQMHVIREFLESHGKTVCCTREPGGTEVSELIREMLLQGNDIHNDTELLLMFSGRSENIQKTIKPALARGEWVVCDRFTDSSYAYQGAGRGMSLGRIAELETWLQGDFRPDLTLILDLPVELAMQRIRKRGLVTDRFETNDLAFFNHIRRYYLEIAAINTCKYRIIDVQSDFSSVASQIHYVLKDFV